MLYNKGMKKDDFKIPSFAKPETYNFDVTDESFEVYRELSEISEEIERCRLRNC